MKKIKVNRHETDKKKKTSDKGNVIALLTIEFSLKNEKIYVLTKKY